MASVNSIEAAVSQYIADERLLGREGLHLVAVSGGADSVALLTMLKRLGYRVEAVHCNFHLRGAESDRDEQFVVTLCKQQSIPLHISHFDTATYADVHQVSIEMAARQLRYRYFEQLRQDIGADEVCVAHHRDDAVETLLMNLVRGTGIHGLTGIRPRNGHVVRPLLCVSRADILHYLDSLGLQYVVDSTNLVPDVVRNKIRLEVLPLLQQINPAASENIALTARRIAEAERLFNATVQSAIAELFVDGTVDIDRLLLQPSPEYILFELLSPRGFTPAQVQQVETSLHRPRSGCLFQSPTHELTIHCGRLVIEERQQPLPELKIPEPGLYRYTADTSFRISVSDDVTVSRSTECATFDAAKVRFPLTVRPVQPADRFIPFGMRGSRLVSDYLTDHKFSIFEKCRQLVVLDADARIVWLVGQRTDQRFAVDPSTMQVLQLQFIPNGCLPPVNGVVCCR